MTYEEKAKGVLASIALLGGAVTLLEMARTKCTDCDTRSIVKLIRQQQKRLRRLLKVYGKQMEKSGG